MSAAINVCPIKDIVCGNRPENWCDQCPLPLIGTRRAAARRETNLQREVDRLGEERDALRAFAADVMEDAWPIGDVDGGALQEYAIKHGLLAETRMAEPCGEGCSCASNGNEFPLQCCRKTALLTGRHRPTTSHPATSPTADKSSSGESARTE